MAIAQTVFDNHYAALNNELVGVIICGSANNDTTNKNSDVDYIVIVETLNEKVLDTLAVVRHSLESENAIPMSNTVITVAELMSIAKNYRDIDGKAVQAIIELDTNQSHFVKTDLTPVSLNTIQIKDFSYHNFMQLLALSRKILIRSTPLIQNDDAIKLSKIAIIMIKMLLQAGLANQETTNNLIEYFTGIKNGINIDYTSLKSNLLAVYNLINTK